jgi:hypothetical protein
MLITRVSAFTNKEHTMDIPITQEEFNRLKYSEILPGMGKWSVPGKNIQEAFPFLTPNQREFLMTGITAEEWDDLFEEN